MSSVNKVIIMGRLGADPEVRYTQSNIPVATLSVATSEKWKDKDGELQETTEWHRIILWDKLASLAGEYLAKGAQVYIEGAIQTRKYEDKEGNTRYTTEIKGQVMKFIGGKSDRADQPGPPAAKVSSNGYTKESKAALKAQTDVNFDDDMDDDDGLPF
jgi:single-strand DNA-binding protein